MTTPTMASMTSLVERTPRFDVLGKVHQVVGLVAESDGPSAAVGDVCEVFSSPGSPAIPCEVVGFRGGRVLLMPFGDMSGVRAGSLVRGTGKPLTVPVGDSLFGRVLDALGRPIDRKGPISAESTRPSVVTPPSALARQMISKPFLTGVRAIDACARMGQGQRVGVFAGSGVGKSTLLGMVARHGLADVNVVALIGERGREVREFMENDLGPEGLAKSVVVCATSDEPALMRIKASLTATAIAEHFRDQGKNVLLMMDSVTRFAMAQREIGLAVGEPPSSKGYTPSVFALLPKLMERAGCSDRGAITAIYTVLVEGDDTNEPIADAARSILDGHVVLSRKLSNRGHYPPVDVLQSLSRTMPMVSSRQQIELATGIRELIGAYQDVEDLVSIGAYKQGAKPLADRAIEKWTDIENLLRQHRDDRADDEGLWSDMEMIVHG